MSIRDTFGGPSIKKLIEPVFQALRELGGAGSKEDIKDRVAKSMDLSDEIINMAYPSGVIPYDKRIYDALMELKISKVVTSDYNAESKKNIYKITPEYVTQQKIDVETVNNTYNKWKSGNMHATVADSEDGDAADENFSTERGTADRADQRIDSPSPEDNEKAVSKTPYITGIEVAELYKRNWIFFGAPGTGKSYMLNEEKRNLLGIKPEDDELENDQLERVTFHPDYTYASFVGAYKPVEEAEENGRKDITYKFVPGPFMRTYVNAWNNALSEGEKKPFLLIIEEINRANAAAVFGDVFQLLDRKSSGYSEYPVKATEDIRRYLEDNLSAKNLANIRFSKELRIPDNMFIWATMNSADQGVFPMDTAFKRRWDFKYIGIDDNDGDLSGKKVKLSIEGGAQTFEWNDLRKAINKWMSRPDIRINEDNQLGPYYISRDIVVPEDGDIDEDAFRETFKDKVLMYLFEDAAKQKRDLLFTRDSGTRYSEICNAFDNNGVDIFTFADDYLWKDGKVTGDRGKWKPENEG